MSLQRSLHRFFLRIDMPVRHIAIAFILPFIILLSACQPPALPPDQDAASAESAGELVWATTTSTYDSGLLDAILPDFEQKTGIKVDVVAVGTGQALKLGEAKDADVLLVHAKSR
jgi:tungstate transport system substrate-binding protein